MQYAQVLINTKTDKIDQEFTYLIPPKLLTEIKIGVEVKVPFRNSLKSAIVSNIIRHVNLELKSKLKPIKSVFCKYALLSDIQLKLAKQISHYYLSNMGQVIYFMIPKLSSRLLKKENFQQLNYLNSNKNYGFYKIIASKEKRYKTYVKLIDKTFRINKSVMYLLPDLKANSYFINKLQKLYKNTIVFSHDDNKTDTTYKWLQFKKTKSKLIIGTRNTVLHNIDETIGLIIVDEPDHFGFKEEQTIHHNAKKVAQFAAKLLKCNLVFGDNYPISNTSNFYNLSKKFKLKKPHIILIDQDEDIKFPPGYQCEKLVSQAIDKKHKLLIITNGKDDNAGIICDDCKNILYCPRCEHMLGKNDNLMHCPNCNYKKSIFLKCPACKSPRLVGFGTTTKYIYKLLSKMYPGNIALIDNFNNLKNCNKDANVFISTKYIKEYKQYKFNQTYILNWQIFTKSNRVELYNNIMKDIFDISEITKNHIYIRAQFDELLLMLAKGNFEKIFKLDMFNKKKYKYPPFYKLIKFEVKDYSKIKSDKKINLLRSNLSSVIDSKYISNIIEIGKKRDKYHSTLVIKTLTKNSFLTKNILLKNYKKLKLSDVQIDVDPITLI